MTSFCVPRRRLPSGELIPLECDEQALHYFYAQKASLPMAKLRLASDLGMKKGKPPSPNKEFLNSPSPRKNCRKRPSRHVP